MENYLLSELGVNSGPPVAIGRGQGLNRRLPIRGIQSALMIQNESESHVGSQQNTNMRSTLSADSHKMSVANKSVSHRFDLVRSRYVLCFC